MRTKQTARRLLSVLLCLVLALSLLPTAVFAAETTATGSGTETDPYLVSNFKQLQEYLRSSEREIYIRITGMDGTEGEDGQITRSLYNGNDFSSGNYGAALVVLGKKHLEIPKDINLRFIAANQGLDSLIYVTSTAELSITGEGSINVEFYDWGSRVIRSRGKLTVDGNVLFDARQNPNWITYAGAIAVEGEGETTINGGRFYGYSNIGPSSTGSIRTAISVDDKASLTINGGEFRTFGDTSGNIPSIWHQSHGSILRLNWTFSNNRDQVKQVNLRGGTFGDICLNEYTFITEMLDADHQVIKMETNGSQKSYRSLSDAELAETWVIKSEFMVIPKNSLTNPTLTANGTPISTVSGGGEPAAITPGTKTFTVTVDSPAWLTGLEKQDYVNYTTKLLVMKGSIPLSSGDYTIGEITKAEQTDGTSKVKFDVTLKNAPAAGDVYRIAAVIQPVSGADDSNNIGNPAYGSWTLMTELSKTLTSTVHYTSSAVFGKPISTSVTGLPTNFTGDLTRQWQRSTDNGETWTDISGATQYTPTAADMDEKVRLRVKMTAEGWFGELVSAPVKVSKAANNADPGIPTLTAEKDAYGNYTTFTITDFDKDKYYFYTTSAVNGWPTSSGAYMVSPTVYQLTPGTTYYVYSRYKGTDTTEAGTVVRRSSVLLNDITKLNKLVLSDSAGNTYTDYGTGNTIYVEKNENVTLNVAKNPVGANTWSDFTVKSPNAQSVFSVTSPTTAVASGDTINSITIKGESVGSATLGAYYNGTMYNYGTWKVVVYDPANVQSSQLGLASTPKYEDLTLSVNDTAALPTALPDLLPADSGYNLEWRIPWSSMTGGGYKLEDEYIKLDDGKIVPKAAHTSGSTTLSLVAIKDGTASAINGGSCSFTVTVTNAPGITPTGLTMSLTKSLLKNKETNQLTAVKTPVNAEGDLTWDSSNPEVATVDKNGKVTAVAPGKAEITVTCGGKMATCTVLVDHEHSYSKWISGGDAGHYRTCSCDAVETAPHDWVYDAAKSTPATETSTGTKVSVCKDCGATKTETIAKLTPSGSGSSSGGGVSTYDVTVKDAKNGAVTADRKTASSGAAVTLTVKPAQGWTLETLTVLDKNSKEVELTIVKVGETYTFKMPSSSVTVTATFMEDNTILNYFVDVPTSSYYYDAVLWAVEQGITQGTDNSHFSPSGICTRAQAVTFLWRAAGSPAPKATAMPFTDVKSGVYYYDAVLWAVENGITRGTSDTTFSPNQTCSRAQIVTFLWRAENSPAAGTVNPFTDVKADAYYADAVLWAVKENVTKGTTDTTFSPSDDCTRAQIVTFIYRCMK